MMQNDRTIQSFLRQPKAPRRGREASKGRKGSCGGAVRLREHILDADGVAARQPFTSERASPRYELLFWRTGEPLIP